MLIVGENKFCVVQVCNDGAMILLWLQSRPVVF